MRKLIMMLKLPFYFGTSITQLAFANPGGGVAQKLEEAGYMDLVGREWFFVTVGEAVDICSSRLDAALL